MGSRDARNLNELGIELQLAGHMDEALDAFDRAILLDPRFAAAYANRGIALSDLRRLNEAVESYRQAISEDPLSADTHVCLGNALAELGRHEQALESYRQAVGLRPEYAEAHFNLGVTFRELNRAEEALQSFERVIQLKPDHEYAYGLWLLAKLALCEWTAIDDAFAMLFEKIRRGEKAAPPFAVLVAPSTPALQRKAAETWVLDRHPADNRLPPLGLPERGPRIRIGYFSADFHDHATSHLMAGLFEQHDRARFELTAFSWGPERGDAMRGRVSAAFERFIDVRELTDLQVATKSRYLGIDIAIDLKGFSHDSRTGIFALRAAPVQASHLVYPGTMGASYIDYLIADATLIPPSDYGFYAEKVACLPHSYQPNDNRREDSGSEFTREGAGLPTSGFVFCGFNNNFKILPPMFDCWMRILAKVDDSVLWLLADNSRAASNLRAEASARGVAANRLVFASRLPPADHLARHKLADLFLDTLPCNAHTTASDALWAGLPVLTCEGGAFAGRVAASLLNAIELPELIAPDLASYEETAIALAQDPARLSMLARRLQTNRARTALFDTVLFARHLEAAYETMYERSRSGLKPAHFEVKTLPDSRNQSG